MKKIATKITGIEEQEYFTFHQDKREINISKVEALIKDALENECDNGENMIYVVNCARKYTKDALEETFDDSDVSRTSKIWIRNFLNKRLRAKISHSKIVGKKLTTFKRGRTTFGHRRSSVSDAGFEALTLDPIPKFAKFDFSHEPHEPVKTEKPEKEEIESEVFGNETFEIVLNECGLTDVS